MKNRNIVQEKTYAFALKVVKLYRRLALQKQEREMSRQLLHCGTSIGANVEEAIGGQSGRDFLAKMSIAYKEAREAHYWLRLLRDSGYIEKDETASFLDDCEEIMKLTGSIIKTMKTKD